MPIDARKTKAEADYQNEAGCRDNCSRCPSFILTDSTCRQVRGAISPNGLCDLFPKPAEKPLLSLNKQRASALARN